MPKKPTPQQPEIEVETLLVPKKRTTSLSSMLAAESQETQVLLHDIARLVNIFKAEINEDPAIVAYLIRKVNPVFSGDTFTTTLDAVSGCGHISIADQIKYLQEQTKLLSGILIDNFYTTLYNIIAAQLLHNLIWHKIVLYGAYIASKNN